MRRVIVLGVLAFAAVGCPDNNSGNNDMAVSTEDMAGGGDGGACTEGARCEIGGKSGLCKSGACAECADPADDGACQTAYGSVTSSFICESGSCVSGCRTSAACAGKLCGVTTTRRCGDCATDVQCEMMAGAGTICETATGKCITNTCSTAGAQCAANAADFCCPSGTGNQCFPGNCCSNSQCGDAGLNCVNHFCTNCPPPTGNTLVVDPSEIPGGMATGADVPGCRYKTITAAIAARPGGNVITTIKVIGSRDITGASNTPVACTDSTIECFPILVPPNVLVVGDTTMRPTIRVAEDATGFTLSGANSGVTGLDIDGQAGNLGKIGVFIDLPPTPSPTPAPFIDHVGITRFQDYGVQVSGGSLDVKPGVTISGTSVGLFFQDGIATVTGGADPISITNNSNNLEINDATVTMTGTVTGPSTGSVMLKDSKGTAVVIQSGTKQVTMTGVVVYNNGTLAPLYGMQILGPRPVKLRNCSVLKSTSNGVIISTDPTGINLGVDLDPGRNTFQATGTDANANAGICLTAAGTLPARGNIFRGVDCTASTGPINFETTCLGAGIDIASATGTIEIQMCNSN